MYRVFFFSLPGIQIRYCVSEYEMKCNKHKVLSKYNNSCIIILEKLICFHYIGNEGFFQWKPDLNCKIHLCIILLVNVGKIDPDFPTEGHLREDFPLDKMKLALPTCMNLEPFWLKFIIQWTITNTNWQSFRHKANVTEVRSSLTGVLPKYIWYLFPS